MVQFLWQEKQEKYFPKIDLTTIPISTEALNRLQEYGYLIKTEKKSNQAIVSSFKPMIQYKKTTAEFELLELQWFLHRIQGMAGAADVEWPCSVRLGLDISDMELPDLEL